MFGTKDFNCCFCNKLYDKIKKDQQRNITESYNLIDFNSSDKKKTDKQIVLAKKCLI